MHEAEKRAFLGLAARGLGMGAGLAARGATSLAGKGAKGVGNVYWRAAQNAPGATALGTAATVATAPLMLEGDDPATKREKLLQKMRRRHLAARAGGVGMKTASVHFDEDEVRQAVAIRRQLEKTAGRAKSMKQVFEKFPDMFTAGLMLGMGTGAAGAATSAASYGAGKLSEMAHASGRNRRFEAMLKADPSLKRDPKARSYFNILDKASPYIAGEPHVAASTVRTMLESPEGYGAAPRMMKDILGVESERQKTRFPMLQAPTFKAELPDID
jgi:hypothetical protein